MGLPTSLPAMILDMILSNSEKACSVVAERNAQMIGRRFGHDAINCADLEIDENKDEEGVE